MGARVADEQIFSVVKSQATVSAQLLVFWRLKVKRMAHARAKSHFIFEQQVRGRTAPGEMFSQMLGCSGPHWDSASPNVSVQELLDILLASGLGLIARLFEFVRTYIVQDVSNHISDWRRRR